MTDLDLTEAISAAESGWASWRYGGPDNRTRLGWAVEQAATVLERQIERQVRERIAADPGLAEAISGRLAVLFPDLSEQAWEDAADDLTEMLAARIARGGGS